MGTPISHSPKKILLIMAICIGLVIAIIATAIAVYRNAEDRPITETTEGVLAKAQDSSDIVGVPYKLMSLSASSCTGSLNEVGDTVYSVRGGFHFEIDNNEVVDHVEKVHKTWKKRGWNITDYRHVSDGVLLVADDPETGFHYRMDGYADDGFVNAPISSPCFEDPSWQKEEDLHKLVDVPKPVQSSPESD